MISPLKSSKRKMEQKNCDKASSLKVFQRKFSEVGTRSYRNFLENSGLRCRLRKTSTDNTSKQLPSIAV